MSRHAVTCSQSAAEAGRNPPKAPFAEAEMISAPDDGLDGPAPRFIKKFETDAPVTRAMLAITSLGVHDAQLNGSPISDHELAPGWTDYRHRLAYDRHDVTDLMAVGLNCLEVTIGNGWYRGRLGRPARRDLYGSRLGLIAELEVHTVDGRRFTIGTDHTWQCRETEVLKNDLYDGCSIDHRRSSTDTEPVTVELLPFQRDILRPRRWPPVRVTEKIAAQYITRDEHGALIVDFGQNLVGWAVLDLVNTRDGQHVHVSHAEVIIDGQLQTAPLRDARSVDDYVLAASARVTLRPKFTFHGFRYARISGIDADQLVAAYAAVVGSDLRRTGWLTTSDPRLNRLHENTVWSLRGNFVSLPTDCPQRDERLGWTADIQLFAPTATFLYDVDALLRSWLEDLYAGQLPDGSVPVVVPDIYRRDTVAAAGWGDAVVLVPWELYQQSGDVTVLERAFRPMLRWIERIRCDTGIDLVWSGGHQYGDWLDPRAPHDNPAAAMTDRDLVATAYFYRSTAVTAMVAQVLGDTEEHSRLTQLAHRIRKSFRETFITGRGRMVSESQTAYALALVFGLFDDAEVALAGARLADLVRRSGFTIGTGFLGTPVILDALTATGHTAVAMRLLTQTECPSWLYPVIQGATTVWERWDSLLPNGKLNPGEMTSFNHYAFGAVAAWMHRHLGGLTRLEPGWTRFRVAPPARSGLDFAETRHHCPAGPITVRWRRHDDTLHLDVQVPPGTTAEIVLPDGTSTATTSSRAHYICQMVPATPSSTPITDTRSAMDHPALWSKVVAAIQQLRPRWTSTDVAEAAWPYLDRPLPTLARCVGLSVPTRDEETLCDALRGLEREYHSPATLKYGGQR